MTDIAEMDNVERVGAELDSHRIEFLVVKKTSHHKFVAILLDGRVVSFSPVIPADIYYELNERILIDGKMRNVSGISAPVKQGLNENIQLLLDNKHLAGNKQLATLLKQSGSIVSSRKEGPDLIYEMWFFLGIMVPVCVVLIKAFHREIFSAIKNVEIIDMLIMLGIPFIPTTLIYLVVLIFRRFW
ncbi:hypothetical protein I5445_06325 [Citrobacter farmeri]|uniref:hypothetical protein n=1 Tax=Citrobacter farmeri TaxID=67824 RepID=UPI0019062792|nr:hypothetical protein [Citrobacter farmeri]EKV7297277.1 hypothetical protein [Citrobacter farmeri]MBJ8745378.1 hypothetical protein [Citrobacter farmeri]MBJ8758629.1 hypothetical protein [Citrobacter farmeri]MBJ9017537.1 hypothetical protein [Citrobacter farmeri]